MDVKFREKGFTLEVLDNVADEGKGIIIADGSLVQSPVVHDGMKLTTLLLAIEQGSGIW